MNRAGASGNGALNADGWYTQLSQVSQPAIQVVRKQEKMPNCPLYCIKGNQLFANLPPGESVEISRTPSCNSKSLDVFKVNLFRFYMPFIMYFQFYSSVIEPDLFLFFPFLALSDVLIYIYIYSQCCCFVKMVKIVVFSLSLSQRIMSKLGIHCHRKWKTSPL